jgi:hypothetical protein
MQEPAFRRLHEKGKPPRRASPVSRSPRAARPSARFVEYTALPGGDGRHLTSAALPRPDVSRNPGLCSDGPKPDSCAAAKSTYARSCCRRGRVEDAPLRGSSTHVATLATRRSWPSLYYPRNTANYSRTATPSSIVTRGNPEGLLAHTVGRYIASRHASKSDAPARSASVSRGEAPQVRSSWSEILAPFFAWRRRGRRPGRP